VLRQTEPKAPIIDCFTQKCLLRFDCSLKAVLDRTYGAFFAEMDRYTLAEIAKMPALRTLEQLDLLLMQEVRARKVRRDGIHFQGLRYLSLTLAAYVGEEATIRFDPRDMGEIRVFYKDRFLCPAVSAELAGETIPLRDIIRVRNQRRRELSSILHDRQQVVDALLQLKRGTAPKEINAKAAVAPVSEVRIKRYRNE
jgi:putative transposase